MECQCGLAVRKLSVCLSVCPYVCLSVKLVDCDKTEESSAQIFIPNERSFILVFFEKKNGWWGDPFCLKFRVKLTPLEQKC